MAGRPAFKPTPTQRRKVATAAGAGMAQDQIALALGITKPTLVKHFELELTTGAAVKKMEALDALHLQAKRGHVSAIKAYLLIASGTVPAAIPGDKPAEPETKAPAAKLGKKEVQQMNAAGAADGTGWDGLLPRATTVQ